MPHIKNDQYQDIINVYKKIAGDMNKETIKQLEILLCDHEIEEVNGLHLENGICFSGFQCGKCRKLFNKKSKFV